MADIKVTGLTALTSLSTDDLLMIVDDPGGTPASKKMTAANFIAGVQANTTLNDLSDVTIAGAASGEVLKYNGSGWVNGTDTSYSDEQAQDAVGTILVDSSTVDFTYSDATPSITASVIDGSITTTKLGGDITTAGKALLDDADNSAQRTTLGLGSIAVQAANSVTITGGNATGMTEVAATTVTVTNLDASGSGGTDIRNSSDQACFRSGSGGGINNTAYGALQLDYSTASRAMVTDASKNLIASSVTSTELGLLSGITTALKRAGRETMWIPAGFIKPSASGGCASATTIASAANQPDITSLDFDATTQEYAQFQVRMPKSWDEGTVTFQAIWSHAATTTNFGVVWDLQGVAISDDDAIAVAFGTAQTSTDTGGTTNDLYISPESSAITIAGTPAAEDWVAFRISRVTGNGSDNMAIDARLHGVTLYFTTNAGNDA